MPPPHRPRRAEFDCLGWSCGALDSKLEACKAGLAMSNASAGGCRAAASEVEVAEVHVFPPPEEPMALASRSTEFFDFRKISLVKSCCHKAFYTVFASAPIT